jgi:hypothetical protein
MRWGLCKKHSQPISCGSAVLRLFRHIDFLQRGRLEALQVPIKTLMVAMDLEGCGPSQPETSKDPNYRLKLCAGQAKLPSPGAAPRDRVLARFFRIWRSRNEGTASLAYAEAIEIVCKCNGARKGLADFR